jgi:hypothetical protein
MKTASKIFLLITLIILFSCEDKIVLVKCADCVLDEPLKTDLVIKLEKPYASNVTVIRVYEGNIEDSVLYATKDYLGTETTIPVTLNKKYTVTATYNIGKTYVAIDATTPQVRYEKSQCDDPCYYVYNRDIDLRLKYTK